MLRVALLGCGHISRFHLQAWQQVPGVQVVAACDLESDKARRRAAEFGVPAAFTDPVRLLAEVRPDAVDIATGPETHLPLVRLAAAAGAHILCQKPLAPSLAEAEAIAAAAAGAGVRLMVNENWRWRSWFQRMRQVLAAGDIGQPFACRVEYLTDSVALRLERQPYFARMPRLLLYEAAIHFVDTLRFLLGDVDTVFCRLQQVNPGLAGEDVATLVLGQGPVTTVVEASWSSPGYPPVATESVRIEGTAGTLALEGDGALHLRRPGAEPAVLAPPDPDYYPGAFVRAQQHFADCLRTGAPFATGPEDNLRTLAAVFAGYESAATGQAVRPAR